MPLFLGHKRADLGLFIDAPTKKAAREFMHEYSEPSDMVNCATGLDSEGFYDPSNVDISPADEQETWDIRVDEQGRVLERNPTEWRQAALADAAPEMLELLRAISSRWKDFSEASAARGHTDSYEGCEIADALVERVNTLLRSHGLYILREAQ